MRVRDGSVVRMNIESLLDMLDATEGVDGRGRRRLDVDDLRGQAVDAAELADQFSSQHHRCQISL